MSGDEDGGVRRSAIPLTAGAIVLAQVTMSVATLLGDRLTVRGTGRKPLFLAGLITLPFRCALILWWREWGDAFLLSTQILDGIGGGLFGLIHPYLVADISFGTGRFNLLSKYLPSRIHIRFVSLLCSNTFLHDQSGSHGLFLWLGCHSVKLYWPATGREIRACSKLDCFHVCIGSTYRTFQLCNA